MAKKRGPDGGMQSNHSLVVEQKPDQTPAQAMAGKLLGPHVRNALTASIFARNMVGDDVEKPGLQDYVSYVQSVTAKAGSGDLAIASRLMASQALTMDAMFTELARRAAINMGEYVNAAESYGRLALKAQSNCRATIEALAKLHQPREQTVRHVHVAEGGQAVIADQFHNHSGEQENGKAVNQSLATRASGVGPALLGTDPLGNGVPIPSREGAEALPDARGHESGRA